MNSLTLAMRAKGSVGSPLPCPFPQLEQMRAFLRRGQISLLAGASGGGKTAFMTHWVLNGMYDEINTIPTLYFSSDSDQFTVGSRVAQSILKCTQDEADDRLRESWEIFHEATGHVWWDWKVGPTLQHYESEIEAYALVMGMYPHLIVIDNLMDSDAGYGASEGENQRETLLWGSEWARKTGAHIAFLHHVTGPNVRGDAPIGIDGIMNKVDKRARLILTFHQSTPGFLNVSVVKNSLGPKATDGSWYTSLPWLPERGWFG